MPIDSSLKIQSIQENTECSSIVPGDWLRRRNWSVQQALMLFAGLNPNKPGFTIGADGVLVHLNHVEKLGYELCPTTYALMSREHLQQTIDTTRADSEKRLDEAYKASVQLPVEMLTVNAMMQPDDAIAMAECSKWLKFYDDSEKLLGSFLQAWRESQKETLDHQLPSSTFCRWAADNGLTNKIPWWAEAVEQAAHCLPPEVQGRLDSEGKKLDDLSPVLQDKFKKLVANLAKEKPGAVNNILLIGDTNDNQLKTFLAATKAALEIVGHSRLVDQSTGADDLISRFGKADFLKPTTYGADSRRHRHWVIRQLEAFPFTVGENSSEFADTEHVARIVATTSPDSQTPLPRGIEDLFKIKVDFSMPSEVQAENDKEVSAVPFGDSLEAGDNGQAPIIGQTADASSPDPSVKGGLIEGKQEICKIYDVEPQSFDNTIAVKAKKHERPIFHLKGPNGPPSMYYEDIIFLKGSKRQRGPKK